MNTTTSSYEFENVDGVKLSLKIVRNSRPKSRTFTISYKNEKRKSFLSKTSLFFAILFNVVGFTYADINFMAYAYVVIGLSSGLYFYFQEKFQSETCIFIPTLGIQTATQHIDGLAIDFIPWHNIDDVIIHEAIHMNRVLFYITVLVKPNTEYNPQSTVKLVTLFCISRPRLVMLEKILYELRVLFKESIIEIHDQLKVDEQIAKSKSKPITFVSIG